MKKVSLHSTCDQLTSKLFCLSVLAILMIMLISAIHYHNFEIKEVVDITYETKEVHYLTDDELSLLYSCGEEPICDTCLVISQADAERLMKIAVVEDHTDAESQANIMQVILNRVASPDFPNTVDEVIHQKYMGKYQFSTVTSGKYDRAEPDVNSHLALAMVESGQIKTDALYFEANWAEDTWQSRNLVYVATVGGTRYYR